MQASTKDFTPKQLPFLPGNSYNDPTVTKFHKSQLLNCKDGANLEKISDQGGVDQDLLEKMRTGEPWKATGIPSRPKPVNEAVPEQPCWLKHDRQVLKFIAFFQEAVVEDPNENYRV